MSPSSKRSLGSHLKHSSLSFGDLSGMVLREKKNTKGEFFMLYLGQFLKGKRTSDFFKKKNSYPKIHKNPSGQFLSDTLLHSQLMGW
jgi:hypothetical protein